VVDELVGAQGGEWERVEDADAGAGLLGGVGDAR
jgi:hypothetical protein